MFKQNHIRKIKTPPKILKPLALLRNVFPPWLKMINFAFKINE
jgi:hypothetical protein